ncbi:hypothetical protein Trydic_g10813 [Trypoxylus dichotomus]
MRQPTVHSEEENSLLLRTAVTAAAASPLSYPPLLMTGACSPISITSNNIIPSGGVSRMSTASTFLSELYSAADLYTVASKVIEPKRNIVKIMNLKLNTTDTAKGQQPSSSYGRTDLSTDVRTERSQVREGTCRPLGAVVQELAALFSRTRRSPGGLTSTISAPSRRGYSKAAGLRLLISSSACYTEAIPLLKLKPQRCKAWRNNGVKWRVHWTPAGRRGRFELGQVKERWDISRVDKVMIHSQAQAAEKWVV